MSPPAAPGRRAVMPPDAHLRTMMECTERGHDPDVASAVIAFYAVHNPAKCAAVPDILEDWRDDPTALLEALKRKYAAAGLLQAAQGAKQPAAPRPECPRSGPDRHAVSAAAAPPPAGERDALAAESETEPPADPPASPSAAAAPAAPPSPSSSAGAAQQPRGGRHRRVVDLVGDILREALGAAATGDILEGLQLSPRRSRPAPGPSTPPLFPHLDGPSRGSGARDIADSPHRTRAGLGGAAAPPLSHPGQPGRAAAPLRSPSRSPGSALWGLPGAPPRGQAPPSWQAAAQYERLRGDLAEYQRRVERHRRSMPLPVQRTQPGLRAGKTCSPPRPPPLRQPQQWVQSQSPPPRRPPDPPPIADPGTPASRSASEAPGTTDPPTPYWGQQPDPELLEMAGLAKGPAVAHPGGPASPSPARAAPSAERARSESAEPPRDVVADIAVYRMLPSRLEPQPGDRLGEFCASAAYVVAAARRRGGAVQHTVHVWRGRDAAEEEVASAVRRAAEVAHTLAPPAAALWRESHGWESPEFLALLEGRAPPQLLLTDEPLGYPGAPRLLRCEGVCRRAMRLLEVPCRAGALGDGDVGLLISADEVLLWHGAKSGEWERDAALHAAYALARKRGIGEVRVAAQGGEPPQWARALAPPPGGRGAALPLRSGRPPAERRLLHWSEGELYEVPGGVTWASLLTGQLCVVDAGGTVWVWVGNGLPDDPEAHSRMLLVGDQYLRRSGRPHCTPIALVCEGREPDSFVSAMG